MLLFLIPVAEKKKMLEEDEHNEDDDDEDGEQGKGKGAKKLKAGKKNDAEGEDDIDDEEEVMYLQAIEEMSEAGLDRQHSAQTLGRTTSGSRSEGLEVAVPGPLPSAPKEDVKRSMEAADEIDKGPAAKVPRRASTATQGGGTSKVLPPPSPSPSTPLPLQMPVASGPSGRVQAMSPKSSQMEVEVDNELSKISAKTWPHCKRFLADDFLASGSGQPMALPSVYTKDAQSGKWKAELEKIRPFVSTLERILSDQGKWKDQEIKNAIKAMSKVNSKTDKKVEFEAAKASDQELTLSTRVSILREGFESVRTLKELAISSGKSGSISEQALKDSVMKVQHTMQKLMVPGNFIGFPSHWVQAR